MEKNMGKLGGNIFRNILYKWRVYDVYGKVIEVWPILVGKLIFQFFFDFLTISPKDDIKSMATRSL